MKIKFILFFNIFLVTNLTIYSQTIYISENFDGAGKPTNWTYQYVSGSIDWQYLDGGYTSGEPGTGEPPYAFQGTRNAMFYYPSVNNETTKLITPSIDLSYAIKPELVFWHAQVDKLYAGSYNHDELRVYYRTSLSSPWVKIAEYLDEVTDWTERRIQLPDSSLSSTYYIAFEGKTKNGFGTCIDSMFVIETGITPKYIESIDITQPITRIVPSSSVNSRIIQIDITVQGNDGSIVLDSIAFKSLNTSDSDITNNGVKLFASDDIYYFNALQIGTGQNFIDGTVSFDNLNHSLPVNTSSLWLTYDIIDDVSHELQNHILDAYIPEDGIKINNNYYPALDQSPIGNRKIAESIFYDNFESGLVWALSGEFEHGIPEGRGGPMGSPDPDNAASGQYVIGTDLSGLGENAGNYENSLTYHAYEAITPTIDAEFYKSTKLYFSRWLNIEVKDSARIEYSTNGTDWNKIWLSNSTINDYQWQFIELNTSSFIDKKTNLQLNFSLGETNSSWTFSGWNIDDVFLTGDYIAKDVGITDWIAPLDGCGHTDTEYVTVEISNFAGDILTDPLPLSYSFNGGTTVYRDTIQSPNIPVRGSIIHQINNPIDLTTPGWYNNVYATTNLPGDEESVNNKLTTQIFITPTYSLPYSQNFETNYGYYRSGGVNSTWAYGAPAGTLINSAASGSKAWVTNLNGNYLNSESSYLESPCFNFGTNDSIIFEFKCKGLSEDVTDGFYVQYSLDEGENWIPLPDDHDYYWNWYNETNISSLGNAGIDSTNNQWLTFRQLLPPALSNQSLVKFRFVFKSNASVTYEGFGIDDIKIYDAPYDVGVTSIDYPYDRCEWNDTTHVKIQVKNYGPTPVKSGTKIPLVLKFNTITIKDTLTLSQNLAVNGTASFTFTNTVDMSYSGAYDFTIYTKLESDTYFYYETASNDTLYATVNVLGMPRYNPFPNQIGDNPIDTFLVAGTGYTTYVWDDGGFGISDFTPPQDTLYVDTERWYKVTVTNANGCSANDSIEVVSSEINLEMEHIYTELADSCERNLLTEISVRFKNNNIDLEINDTVALAYQINDLPIVRDTLFVASLITTGSTEDFTFDIKADFTAIDHYTFKVFIDFLKDLDHTDDTLYANFDTKGYVDIDFAFDSIYSSEADTLFLSPNPLYDNYTWSPGESTNDTLIISQNISQWYKAVVWDSFVCGSDSDSVYIETYDMAIINLNSPANRCENNITGSTDINVRIKNYSGNTYNSSTPLTFMYNFNGAGWTEKNMTLGTSLAPNAETNLSIVNIDRSAPGEYTVDVYLKSAKDANNSNDSISGEFETYPKPYVNLPYDTIYTTQADTVVLIATPGWLTYEWSNGIFNDTLEIINNYSDKYVVTVTDDEHGCGSALDSTQILTYNISLKSITKPKNACSHSTSESISIVIENNSNDIIFTGEDIIIGYKLDNNPIERDTIILSADLFPSQTLNYTFKNKVNLSTPGTYAIKVFTDYKYDVYRDNDTISTAVKTFGNPSIELGGDIFTTQPDTVVITADPNFTTYFWNDNDGLMDNVLYVSYPATKLYSVTVTNANGCSATDNLTVYTYNVIADALSSPIEECEPTASETVTIGVTNNSEDILQAGEGVEVGYILNSGNYVSQQFTLTETLNPDNTEFFTLTSYPADLRENITHEFKVFAKLTNIDVETDDTTTIYVDNLKPDFDLGPDVQTSQTQYTIDAGAGYTTYQWFNGSANRTYTVDINDQKPNFYYAVTVTNSFGCQASDSIMVTFDLTPDLQMISMSSPVSDCWQSGETYPVQVTLQNVGEINIAAGTPLSIGYRINNGTAIIENVNLSSALNADQTLNHTFASEIDFASAQVYIFKPFVKYSIDADPTNDTLTVSLDISQPDVTFDYDTVYFSATADIEPIQNFSSYLWSTGATTKRITVSETGTYTVTVTDANGCSGSGKVYCEKLTGIENIIEGNGYSIAYFPNPVSEKLQVQFNNSQSMDVVMEIITPNGQIIYNKQFSKIQNTIERIDVNQFANGIYYIRFRVNDEYFTRKIIIQ